jgi:hypothetical protein
MSNTSSYPYVPGIWNDGTGVILGLRLTLSTQNAAIFSAVLAIVLSFTIARFASLVTSTLYLIFLYKRIRSTFDDQADILAVNSGTPSNLFIALISLGLKFPLKALCSTVFMVFFVSSMLFLPLYAASVFTIGRLVSDVFLPMTLGTCGTQNTARQTSNVTLQNEDIQIDKLHRLRTFQWLESSLSSDCTDNGTTMTCFGPTNNPYSWSINTTESSVCWFGDEYCSNQSKTILQFATITTADLGTTRKSKLAVTYVSECSHVDTVGSRSDDNLSTLITENATFPDPPNIKTVNESFYGFYLGNTNTPIDNFTRIVWNSDSFSGAYSMDFWTYPSSPTEWTPLAFLTDRLNKSNALDNRTGSQSVTLIFNRLSGVTSVSRNDDPFFLTQPHPSLGADNSLYMWAKPAGLLACRDQMRLHVRTTDQHPQGYTSDDVVAVGRYEDVSQQFESYLDELRVWDNDTARILETDWNLFAAASQTPNIRFALDGLSGRGLLASETLQTGSQIGYPSNISARAEVTRWFALTMLYRLYSAQIFTSGVDNDWGFGVVPIQSLEGLVHWVCSSTLRMSSTYTSINFAGVIGLLILSLIIVTASFTLRPILLFLFRRSKGTAKLRLQRAMLADRLRGVLQLHRIAVEKTYGYRFSDTASQVPVGRSEAPIYGVKVDEESGDQSPGIREREVFGTEGGDELTTNGTDRGSQILYATMLQIEEENPPHYNIDQLR